MMKDILKERTSEFKVAVENGEVKAFRSKDLTKTGARVFENGQICSASYVGEISDEELFQQSLNNKVVAMPTEVEIQSSERLHKDISQQCLVSKDELAKATESQVRELTKLLPQFIFNGHNILRDVKSSYTNTLGADLQKSYSEVETVYMIRRKGSPNIIDDFMATRDFFSLEQQDYLELLVEQLSKYDKTVNVNPGIYNVMFEVDDWSHLGKLSESFKVDKYCDGTALYSGKNNSKILNEKVSVFETYVQTEKGVLNPFDGEGTVNHINSRPLVENGILKGQICDLRLGKKYDCETTGNGFRSFNGSTTLSFSGLQLLGGKRSYREILADAGEVILIKLAAGGDFTDKGDFSTPVQLAYLVKNGEVKGRLNPIAVSSSIEKMFGTKLLEVASNGLSRSSLNPFALVEMDVQVY